jgi:hypothetical protein
MNTCNMCGCHQPDKKCSFLGIVTDDWFGCNQFRMINLVTEDFDASQQCGYCWSYNCDGECLGDRDMDG